MNYPLKQVSKRDARFLDAWRLF